MSTALTPLAEADDPESFGGKSAQLSEALRAGLPVPEGFALDWNGVNAFVAGESRVLDAVLAVADECPWAVVLQRMVAADVAGVMFTRNPVSGVAERVIEASWGLGEMVVSGRVTPDQYRLAPQDGRLLERFPGEKDLALHLRPDGTVAESEISGELVEACCLDGAKLDGLHQLAARCDEVFGTTEHDIEFAFAGDRLHLLQRRPITHG